MSQTAGSRSDYVQGGGGNTSCKVDETLMVIKASGYRIEQIERDQAYAVLDYSALRRFYNQTHPESLSDVEQEGSAQARTATQAVNGIASLRPSVEAGFHSLLDRFVLHTHPVYANLVACSAEGPEVAAAALADFDAGHVFVPYINPGAQLTFAIQDSIRQKTAKDSRPPRIMFLQNHGLVITGDEADDCLALHDQVNERLAAAYGVSTADWPEISVQPAGEGDRQGEGQTWVSATPWLRRQLLEQSWDLDFFKTQSLYPDQLVYLGGQLAVVEKGTAADLAGVSPPGLRSLKATGTIFRQSGEIVYRCSWNEAKTIEETLCAVWFIHRAIRLAGRTVCTMGEAGRQFISNWESEHYRKTITAR